MDARAYGFATAEAYADARTSELHSALLMAGVPGNRVTQLGIPDQQAIRNLGAIAGQLHRLFNRDNICLVLTHVYEGGHPDHDATAFCVHQAAQLSSGQIAIIEMPYYRANGTGAVQQSFAPDGTAPTVIPLSEQERCRKRQMIAAYKTQANVLAGFSVETEQFRVAPDYDFRQMPNGGRILYERENWGATGKDWLRAVNHYVAQVAVAA
jgi:LmbE family N-acetylglucosaminyl deacetylase